MTVWLAGELQIFLKKVDKIKGGDEEVSLYMKNFLNIEYVEGNIENIQDIRMIMRAVGEGCSTNSIYNGQLCHELVICCTQSVLVFCNDSTVHSSGFNAFFLPAGLENYQLNYPIGVYKRFFVQFPVDFITPESVDQNLNEFFCCSLKLF